MSDQVKHDTEVIVAQLLAKYKESEQAVKSIDTQISRLQQKRLTHEKNISALLTSARLFNVTLPTKTGEQLPLSAVAAGHGATVKEHALARAKEAYPSPVRASILRAELEKARNEVIHEKTVGMTLYRLLQKGELRREKHDWFFVPEGERDKEKPPHTKYGGVSDD